MTEYDATWDPDKHPRIQGGQAHGGEFKKAAAEARRRAAEHSTEAGAHAGKPGLRNQVNANSHRQASEAYNTAATHFEEGRPEQGKAQFREAAKLGHAAWYSRLGRDTADPDTQNHQLTQITTVVDADVRRSTDGYLTAVARVARSGIQLYSGAEVGRPDLSVVRVYRPPEEVFDRRSMRSYAHRPVTNDHPPVNVDASNWRRFSVGQTGDKVTRDGDHVTVPLALMDAETIKDYESGKRELSLGYSTELDWTGGTLDNGEEYDATQRNIRANHLAVVASARGGSNLRIGDDERKGEESMTLKTVTVDGLTVEMTEIAAQQVGKTIATKDTQITQLQTQLSDEQKRVAEQTALSATKDAEIATLKKQAEDAKMTPQRLDDMVKERQGVLDKARALIGTAVVADGRTSDDIRRQVVSARLGDVAKGWTDDQVRVSFDTLAASVKAEDNRPTGSLSDNYATLSSAGLSLTDAEKKRDEALAARDERLRNRWRGGKHAVA